MEKESKFNISEETIKQVGLRLSDKPINADIAEDARVFEYSGLEKVYIMESDLYGNTMPDGSWFLVFEGKHGLMGQHLSIEMLKKSSVQEI